MDIKLTLLHQRANTAITCGLNHILPDTALDFIPTLCTIYFMQSSDMAEYYAEMMHYYQYGSAAAECYREIIEDYYFMQ